MSTDKPRRFARVALVATVSSVLAATTFLVSSPASADELPQIGIESPGGSRLVGVTATGSQQLDLLVYSASMNKNIPLSVLLPRDRSVPRPTLYLLNGAGGGEDSANWEAKTDVRGFFANKNVNVVTPNSGAFSYYTDWQRDDPQLGRNKWSTFLGNELPPIIDQALGTTGLNSIAGISSSATSVLNLAIEHPGLYKSVGSYSGCASTASPLGQWYIEITVAGRGGGNVQNMWGPVNGPGWAANDPIIKAEGLRGVRLYISNATGLPGQYENLDRAGGDVVSLADQVIVGGAIEAATGICTVMLQNRLNALNIPATYDFPPAGTHSWGYWEDQLYKSWRTLAAPIGA